MNVFFSVKVTRKNDDANDIRNVGGKKTDNIPKFEKYELPKDTLLSKMQLKKKFQNKKKQVEYCVTKHKNEYKEKIQSPTDVIPKYNSEIEVLGAGSNGIVILEKSTEGSDVVRKMSKVGTEDIDNSQFLHEFCIGNMTESQYLSVVEKFSPYDISLYPVLNTKSLDEKVTEVSINTEEGNFVPSFETEKCEDIDWTKLDPKDKEQSVRNMVYAANHVHKVDGISMLDVKEDNIMICNGEVRFIDMGMARLFDCDSQTTPLMMFGTPYYRSPWAMAFDEFFTTEETPSIEIEKFNTGGEFAIDKDKFYEEYEAYDFWSIGIVCMRQMCGLQVDALDGYIKAFWDEIDNLDLKKGQKYEDFIEVFGETAKEKLISGISNELCPESTDTVDGTVRKLLSDLLEVNPEKRLENGNFLC